MALAYHEDVSGAPTVSIGLLVLAFVVLVGYLIRNALRRREDARGGGANRLAWATLALLAVGIASTVPSAVAGVAEALGVLIWLAILASPILGTVALANGWRRGRQPTLTTVAFLLSLQPIVWIVVTLGICLAVTEGCFH